MAQPPAAGPLAGRRPRGALKAPLLLLWDYDGLCWARIVLYSVLRHLLSDERSKDVAIVGLALILQKHAYDSSNVA